MNDPAPALWRISLDEAQGDSSVWRAMKAFVFAMLPVAIILGALYLCSLYYDQSQQEDLRRDYVSTCSFRLIPKQIAAELDSAHVAILENNPFTGQLRRAGKASAQLEEIFSIYDSGGVPSVFAASKRKLWVRPLVSVEARTALGQAQALYQPMHVLLQGILQQPNPDSKQVAAVAELFDARSSRFLPLGDVTRLHAMEEAAAAIQQKEIALGVTILAAFGLLLALGFGFYYAQERRRLRLLTSSNEQLAGAAVAITQAKRETDLILSTVNQGMFLMGADSTIGDQYSASLKQIFVTERLAGVPFLSLLQRVLTEKVFLTTRDYFGMLFDGSKKEKLLAKINPLSRVEANFVRPDGGFATKHLEFTFRRILGPDGTGVARVFVSVRDITPQVELETSLQQAEQKKERQFELLLGVLHVGPDALKEFLALVEAELQQINTALKSDDHGAANGGPRQTAALRERLDVVFRCVHNIKGNADFLKLEHFSKSAHAFEDKISELKARPKLAGDDFLGVTIHQAEMRTDLDEMRDLAEKLASLRQGWTPTASPATSTHSVQSVVPSAAPAAGTAADGLFDGVRTLAASLATRLGKEVEVQAAELNGATPPEAWRGLMRDILIQLTRNSLVHGVETPAERMALGKPRRATLSIEPPPNTEMGYPYGFVFRDDGRGLDPTRIRRRAVDRGLITEHEAAGMEDAEAAMLIFESGFSTAEDVTGDAGRGVGLDLVRTRIIDELGGDILIESEPGRFCEFTFLLPAEAPRTEPFRHRDPLALAV